jgi:stage V sporulation protein SpoVS
MKMVKNNEAITVLKVAGTTNPSSLAGALVKGINNNETCELLTIGAGPCNQAMKAVAIANRLLGSSGVSLSVKPCFFTLDLSNEKQEGKEGKSEVTALKFKVIVEN